MITLYLICPYFIQVAIMNIIESQDADLSLALMQARAMRRDAMLTSGQAIISAVSHVLKTIGATLSTAIKSAFTLPALVARG